LKTVWFKQQKENAVFKEGQVLEMIGVNIIPSYTNVQIYVLVQNRHDSENRNTSFDDLKQK
jgi:hypothetical protein